jgi:hypothetical protein
MADQQSPLAKIHRTYVGGEARAASAVESAVGSNAFGELLAMSASNAMALARLANGGIDRGVRALRVAGRADIADLGRQLARAEDKLERMLQLVEELEGRLDAGAAPSAGVAEARPARPVKSAANGMASRSSAASRAAGGASTAASRRRTS